MFENITGKKRKRKLEQDTPVDARLLKKPKNFDELIDLGIEYFNQENFLLAIQRFKEAIEINADDPHVWFNLGMSYEENLDSKQAIDCYTKSLELDPYNSDVWYHKGYALVGKADYWRAIECYKESIKLLKNAKVLCELSKLYKLLGNHKEARKYEKQAAQPKKSFTCH